MKETIFYIGDNGEIKNPVAIKRAFNLEKGRYKLTIEDANKRSLPQNAWFHSVLPDIARGLREVGFTEVKTPEDAKAVVKALFFKKKVSNGIDTVEVIEGTSEQTKLSFAEKATEIIDWAASYLGIQISPPSSQVGLYDVTMEASYDQETKTTIVR